MAIFTVTDDILRSVQARDYFTRTDRRVMIGLRAALELLGIPLPEYAERKPAGPRTQSANGVAARYAADNPGPRPVPTYTAPARTPASDARLTAKIAERSAKAVAPAGNLFNQTFTG